LRFVDLEDDFKAPVVEEACQTFGTRIIRSHHFLDGVPEDLDAAYEALTQQEGEIPKLTVSPQNSAALLRFLEWTFHLPAQERILVASGAYGLPSRLLAWRLGSLWTYASPLRLGETSSSAWPIRPSRSNRYLQL